MLEGELEIGKEKKVRDSEEESGFLNVSEELRIEGKEGDESCSEKIKNSFLHIFFTLVFIAFFGVIMYRYLWMLNNPKIVSDENVPKNPSLQKHLPFEDNKTSVPSINPIKDIINIIKPLESNTEAPKIKEPESNVFPEQIWVFDKFSKDLNHSYNDYMRNWEHYSQLSNLTVQKVTKDNYKTFIKDKKVIEMVEKLASLPVKQESKEKILEQLIMLALLKDNGGVTIGGDMIFTKTIDEFLKIVSKHPNSTMFIFDSLSTDGLVTFDHKNYFIMARRSCPVMERYVEIIMGILEVEIGKIGSSETNSLQEEWTEVLLQIITTSFGLLLKSNLSFKNNVYLLGNQDDLNIENTPFLNFTLENHFKYLSSLEQKSLEEIIGVVKPITLFSSKLYEKYVLKNSEDEKNQIIKDSFIYQHFLSTSTVSITPFEPKEKHSEEKLGSFPKVIWTFFTKNHISDPLHKHFLQNLLETSKLSKFELVILTESNLKTVLDEPELREIQATLQKMNMNQNQNAMRSIEEDKILSFIIKLKILNKYGGIFIDHGYFFIEDLSWIEKVGSNNHLFNKKPHQFPDAFMFHKHGDFRWRININSGEKESDNVSYLTKFIAGNKDSLLIKNWLRETEKYLILTKEELEHKLFSECQLKGEDFENIFELTLECLLIKSKKADLTKTEDKYNIWSINSLLAGDKMEIISKENEDFCHSFDSSSNEFVKKYGTMGYISLLEAEGSKFEIDSYIDKSKKDSIFGKFFIGDKQTRQETQELLEGQNQDYIKSVLTELQKKSNINKQ